MCDTVQNRLRGFFPKSLEIGNAAGDASGFQISERCQTKFMEKSRHFFRTESGDAKHLKYARGNLRPQFNQLW